MTDLGINKLNHVQAVRVEAKGVNKEPEQKQKKSTVKKVAMAGLAAAGAIGIALLSIKKGNANAVKEIGIDAFKEAGNSFVKGKAITAEGQPFSGIVNTIGKDGSKHSLEYVNGVLKESVKSTPVNIGGKTEYIQVSKKGYNYNAEGKLETVDNFSRAHVTSKDPSQSGLQYIKTKTVNIEAQKAEGLERHAQKQAAKRAEAEAKRMAEEQAKHEAEMEAKFARAEERRKAKNQQYVKDLKTHLHQKTEQSSELVDARLGQKGMPADVRAQQQKFYTEMEEKAATEARLAAEKAEAEAKELARKQAKREEMLKLKEENPAEYKRLQIERKKARHAEHVAQRTRTITPDKNPDIDFKRVINETSEGRVIREYSLDNNTFLREYRVDKYGDRLNSVSYAGDTKVVTGYNQNGNQIEKMFVKNDKGEYELVKRIKDDGDVVKTVERLEDGTTMITKESSYGKNIVIRDKKGNILSEKDISKGEGFEPPAPSTLKLKASWFKHYEKLCKKFDVSPRICGVKGGAGDHYYELCLRESNPEAYRSYLDTRAYRAKYDERAQILEGLDNGSLYADDMKNLVDSYGVGEAEQQILGQLNRSNYGYGYSYVYS